ncbi:MAG TPA: PAS domain S-box protein [Gaiellaceae bacterium]
MTDARPDLEVAALSGEVDAVMRGIVDRLMALPHADGASLSTIEGDIAVFDVCAGADEVLQGRRIPMDETLGVHCFDTNDLVVLRRSTGPEVDSSLTPGAATIVLAPLTWDGALRGILGVRSGRADAFDDAGVEQIRMLAAGASIALRNAHVLTLLHAYRELHESGADATVVVDRDARTILDANAEAAALLQWPLEELRGRSADSLLLPTPEAGGGFDDGASRGERTIVRKDGTQILVEYSARLLEDGRIHASLRDVTSRRHDEERMKTHLARLHSIVETQQEISALEQDADALTRMIVERTQMLTLADGASVVWFDGDDFVYTHCAGTATGHVGLRLGRRGSLAGLAAERDEVLYAADTATDPRVDRAACARVGAASLVCAPLHRDGEVVAMLSLLARRQNAFDELAIETARLMASFVSTVIRNAQELEQRRLLVDELRTQGEVVEQMKTALCVLKREGSTFRTVYLNNAVDEAIGMKRAEALGRTLHENMAHADAFNEIFLDVLARNEVVDLGEIEYGDARIAPGIYAVKAFPLPGERVAVTFDNVTEISRSRRALQESEARFRGAFDSSAVGASLSALDGSFVQVNDRLASMLGHTNESLMRIGMRGITHPADAAEIGLLLERMLAGEIESFDRESRFVRNDGSVVWGHLTSSLVRAYDGTPTHVVSHVHDVTAQKEAHLLFEATFERSVVPKIVFDDSRTIVDVNGAAAALFGVEHDDAIGVTIDALLPEDPIEENWERFLRTGTSEREAWLHTPDGKRHRIEFTATAGVQPGRHIAVIRDLTRQKELEAQLGQAQKMEAVGRLAGGIAHDFNNLLTAISGYSEFLIGAGLDERNRRHAEEIKKAAARAASLTGQLLAFSRRQVLQPRVLDLNAVVSDMDMMLRRLIGEDVELVTLLDPDAAPVRADPTQVEQVIVNLAVNARDAMPHGGSVTIETSNVVTDTGSFVELRLTDTGVGMTDDERQQLFDPFFTTKEFGTGLGLATVYGIVEQSGGAIEVESQPGFGSSFRILFPAAEGEAAPAEAQAAPRDAATGAESILLVEDETVVRQLIAEILESAGYTVLQAGDGPSALELLRRHTGGIDLLITDVVMPGMSGPEVAGAVSSMRPGTHVLYISGYTDSAIGHHGVLEPGIAFLQKPFSADDLTEKVRAVIDGAGVLVD